MNGCCSCVRCVSRVALSCCLVCQTPPMAWMCQGVLPLALLLHSVERILCGAWVKETVYCESACHHAVITTTRCMVGPWGLFIQAALQSAAAMGWVRAEPKLTGWRLPGCAILLHGLVRGGARLLDSAHRNLLTLENSRLHTAQHLSRQRGLTTWATNPGETHQGPEATSKSTSSPLILAAMPGRGKPGFGMRSSAAPS